MPEQSIGNEDLDRVAESIQLGRIESPETIPLGEIKQTNYQATNVPFDKTVAREVARVLLFTFAATVAATFLTIALIYGLSASPTQARDFVKAFVDVIPVMENFIAKIFGPLLAFILGYYFGEKGKTNSPSS